MLYVAVIDGFSSRITISFMKVSEFFGTFYIFMLLYSKFKIFLYKMLTRKITCGILYEQSKVAIKPSKCFLGGFF